MTDTRRAPRLPRGPSRILALLLVGVLLRNFVLVSGVIRGAAGALTSSGNAPGAAYSVVVGGFLLLLGATIVGLFQRRLWGIYCAYALVPVSTILLAVPLIPFVLDLMPPRARVVAMPIVNLAFLAAVVGTRRASSGSGAAR